VDLARIILSTILALLLVVTGGGKVLRLEFSKGNQVALGVSPRFWFVTGCLEMAAVVGLVWGLWFVPFSIAAAVGVVGLMIGAIVVRTRTGEKKDKRGAVADVVVGLIAAGVAVLGVLAIAR
jgi:uncharacterized membrane protein YphA (DoxX/SURF4 family)